MHIYIIAAIFKTAKFFKISVLFCSKTVYKQNKYYYNVTTKKHNQWAYAAVTAYVILAVALKRFLTEIIYMVKYVKCPRCELNYIDSEKQEYCDVCIAELKGGRLQFADLDDEDFEELDAELEQEELCPICGVNRVRAGEKYCETCKAQQEYEDEEEVDIEQDEEWKNYLEEDDGDLTVDDEELQEEIDEEFADEEEDEIEDDFFDGEDVDSLSDLEDDEYDDDEEDEDDDDDF